MSWRKGSTASIETSGGSNGSRTGPGVTKEYPFALALRIRVVQIVCGIAAVVMGSVAAIEEREQVNLSLGLPAGAVTVLAAAWSVHRSVHRSAGGRRGGEWCARVLWGAACSLNCALLVLAVRTIARRHTHGEDFTSNTSLGVAGVQGVLAGGTLAAAAAGARLRCVHGPAPSAPPAHGARCPRSTSHTAVSMVPLTSTYGCPPSVVDVNGKGDINSDNEMMEINLVDNVSNINDIELSKESTRSPAICLPPKRVPNNNFIYLNRQPLENDLSLTDPKTIEISIDPPKVDDNVINNDRVTPGADEDKEGGQGSDSETCERLDKNLI